MMRREASNYKLGRLDKVLVLKFVLTQTDRQTNPDTEFKMVRGRTIKILLITHNMQEIFSCHRKKLLSTAGD